ncbi:ABC transporter ATP-binding protein [Streptomyces sp. NPDC017056]|uniref:ABC transporter ATP-binding protein n=1 Tax=Streptomyces sp. NPDC017056 TaxID=3364973 RepID=UPI0037AA8BC3
MVRATTVDDVTVIVTESLSKRYPRVTALDRLTVDIAPGVTGLVGANGAGKSTLIKLLLGLAPASEGSAAVLGLDVAKEGSAIRERVGYMPEHDCLPPDVSATEFVVHMARMSGLPPTAARERTADTLRHVGLYEERYRPIGGYSTGMKQRVKLAQALVHDPQLVFLDEPTNGLDPVGRDEMLGLIRRVYTDFGISVLVTSHLLGELERTCDHVVVIDGGKLLRSSATDDFTQATASLAVEVTDTDEHPDGTKALRAALAEAGVAVSSAAPGSGSEASAGHLLYVEATGEETYDLLRDTVAGLGLGLVRMEQRRHRISEVFHSDDAAEAGAAHAQDAASAPDARSQDGARAAVAPAAASATTAHRAPKDGGAPDAA